MSVESVEAAYKTALAYEKAKEAHIAAKEAYAKNQTAKTKATKDKTGRAYVEALEEYASVRQAPNGPGDAVVSF